jgi:cold shock CspA family protein
MKPGPKSGPPNKPKNNKRKPASKVRQRDPFYARECEKYDNPLPSREYVLQLLEERGVPLPFERIAAELDVQPHEHEDFTRRLGAMMRDGQVIQNRKGDWLIPDKADLIRGRIEGHPDGFGFLVPDDGGGDLFIGEREMTKVLHGDRALARVVGIDRRGRREGKIVEVIERANSRIVGRVFVEHGVSFVVAENRRITQDILVAPPEKGARAERPKAGQVVVIELIEQPSKHAQPPIPAWRSRSRCASTSCRTSSARKPLARAKKASLARCETSDLARAASTCAICRWSPSTARRRATSTMRSTAIPRARASALRRDRRRQPLRASRQRARPRGGRPRQLGVLPAARDPDAAGGAVERLCSLNPAGRSPVHGLRHGSRPTGEIVRYAFYPR